MSICIFRLEPSSHGSCSCRNKLSGQSSPLFPLVHESTASIKDTSRESVKECQVNILNGWIKMDLGIRCMYACSFRVVSYRFVWFRFISSHVYFVFHVYFVVNAIVRRRYRNIGSNDKKTNVGLIKDNLLYGELIRQSGRAV